MAWLVWAAFADQLGANPAEALIRSLGDWTIRFLVLVLLVTPLRNWRRLAGAGEVEAHDRPLCVLLRHHAPAGLRLV